MTVTVSLSDRQIDWILTAADNRGLVYRHTGLNPADRSAVDSLVRCGILTPGSGVRGPDARHLTGHGRHVAADLIRGRAAAIIGRHLDGPDRIEQAKATAADLHAAGYLTGGIRAGTPDLVAETAGLLASLHGESTAALMAADLRHEHLLAGTYSQEDVTADEPFSVDVVLLATLHIAPGADLTDAVNTIRELAGRAVDVELGDGVTLHQVSVRSHRRPGMVLVSGPCTDSHLKLDDFQEPRVCRRCGSVYDETNGDGQDGECPSCSDRSATRRSSSSDG
ncbi:hypothetical protein C1I95_24615 [Micromonospora craterilacus]|uniref:Uncharacterized protein n=1 Tax=Micromonospora craterilacus TaxID=1655439 RepID=A0A2W2FBT5_9ACTN|nr:hypothetical protein [Micromonospora craterilacus]PZG12994.1 hypothetical protein C1I95_24615 [Micromonospora craterilacus]